MSSKNTKSSSPDEDHTGAIRMVAFDVLVYDPPTSVTIDEHIAQVNAAEEVLRLVKNEVEQLGWLLSHRVNTQAFKRTFVLLGPIIGRIGLKGRCKIAEGTLQVVCKAAVAHLDGEIPVPTKLGMVYPE